MGSFPKLCLRWNNHTANLLDTLDSLLSSQQHSDVTLACQGSVWHLHRLVLSASSTHFAGLLAEVAPGQLPLIIVDGPSRQDIAALICFIYHGEVSVDQEHLPELLKTAAALKIKGLAEFPIDGPPSCRATVRSAPVQGSLASHPSYEAAAAHHKKLKTVETSDYPSGQMSSTVHVAEPLREQEELVDEPEEVLPLNLSCKRDSHGDSRRSDSSSQNIIDDVCYEQRSISYNINSSSVLPDVVHPEPLPTSLKAPVGPGSHIIHDHSRDSSSSSSFYKYVSISNSVPLTLESKPCYVLADVTSKPDVTGSTAVPLYSPVTNRATNADQVSSSWKPSQGVIREARPLLLSDGASNVYHVPPTYSVITPSSSNPSASLQIQQLQEAIPSPLILPQPPMKRLRTVEPVSLNTASIKDPADHQVSAPVSMVGISVPVPSSMALGNPCVQTSNIYTTELNPHARTPIKKYQEIINVCSPQVMKSGETTHEVKVSSYDDHSKPSTIPCIPKYKFIPVKTETFFPSDDGCASESSDASSRIGNSKLGCNIKQETPIKMSSPLQTTESLKDPTLPNNPILSSAFLSSKSIAPSSMHSIVIPKSSPIKCSASPQPHLASGSSSQASPQVSPMGLSPNPQQTQLPCSFNTSSQVHDQKPVLKSLIEVEGTANSLASDEIPSQSASATNKECGEVSTPYYASSPTCSVQTATTGGNTMPTSVTTTSYTPPAGGGTASTAATSTEGGTGSSSQRVSINMRTFKEEWRRQLLVDYDSRTNMSICMLCFTTFKSYDGPRKNTYVKHAKRFHTVLDDYTEEERDMIIKNYEHQYKYDPDMQKEVNKSFKCSGGGPWSGRGGGKVCRSGSLPGTAAHASSGSSTGSSSQPGSRPDTDGEDDHHPHHLLGKGRCESPDSDGSIEVRDTISIRPPSRGCDAGASSSSTVNTGSMTSVTGGIATSQLSSMVVTPHMTSHGTTHTASSMDRLHPGSSASVFSIAGPSLTVMTKAPVYEGSTNVGPQSFAPLSASSAHTSTGILTVSAHSSLLTTSVHSTTTSSSLAATIPSSSTLVFANLVPGSSSATRPSYLFTTQGTPLSAYPLSTPRLPFSTELKQSQSNNNNISTNNKNNCSTSAMEKVDPRPRNKYFSSHSFVNTTSSSSVNLASSSGTPVSSTVACGAIMRANAAVSARPTSTTASSAVVVGTLSNAPQRSTAATCPSSSSVVSPGDSTISVTVPAV